MVNLPAVIGIVILTSIVTVSLVGIGYAVGRWQVSSAAGSPVDPGRTLWIDDREGFAREIVALVQLGLSARRQFEWLATLTARNTYQLPPDVRLAVQRTGEALNRWCIAAETIERRTTLRWAAELPEPGAPGHSQLNLDGNPRQEVPESQLSPGDLRQTLKESQADSKFHAYDCKQFLVPCDDGPPKHEELVPVRCRALSTSGVSFLWPERPSFERVLISLGTGAHLTFMRAKVEDSKCISIDGDLQYLVRCHFRGRASEFTSEWHLRQELNEAAQLAPVGGDCMDRR